MRSLANGDVRPVDAKPVKPVHLKSVDASVVEAITAGVLAALRTSYQSDAAAEGQVKGVGQELQHASLALRAAAEALREAGKGLQANATIRAATRAHEAAEGLLGG